ncbi:MAG: hypothetical protein V4671_19370 [Armatimonadota bacterium]
MERRLVIEVSADARTDFKVLAAESRMTMRDYIAWLASEARRKGLKPAASASDPATTTSSGGEDGGASANGGGENG